MSLFSKLPQPVEPEVPLAHQPLAERMRPRTLDEVIGQEKLLVPASRCARKLKRMIWAPCSSGDHRAAAKPLWHG